VALDTIAYEVTIDDPGAFTAPFSGRFNLRREPGTQLFEYIWEQANYAGELMIGNLESLDRTATTVP
jgi:hypothetical protein